MSRAHLSPRAWWWCVDADDGWRVLLLRVYNYWDCPKGVVEPGEDPLATARREVREETTLDDLDFTGARISSKPRHTSREQGGAVLPGADATPGTSNCR